MEQASGTKKEPCANRALNTNTPTKEIFIMTTVSAPVIFTNDRTETNPYATAARPDLQRHHWQNLAGTVASFRPDWPIEKIIESLWAARTCQDFPELARIALIVAMDPKFKTPGAIGLCASGMIQL